MNPEDDLDYDQPVTLMMPQEDPRTLPLADDVLTALHAVDHVKRVGATIRRDSQRPDRPGANSGDP